MAVLIGERVPDAAEVCFLLDNGVGEAILGAPVSGENTTKATAEDYDVDVLVRRHLMERMVRVCQKWLCFRRAVAYF